MLLRMLQRSLRVGRAWRFCEVGNHLKAATTLRAHERQFTTLAGQMGVGDLTTCIYSGSRRRHRRERDGF